MRFGRKKGKNIKDQVFQENTPTGGASLGNSTEAVMLNKSRLGSGKGEFGNNPDPIPAAIPEPADFPIYEEALIPAAEDKYLVQNAAFTNLTPKVDSGEKGGNHTFGQKEDPIQKMDKKIADLPVPAPVFAEKRSADPANIFGKESQPVYTDRVNEGKIYDKKGMQEKFSGVSQSMPVIAPTVIEDSGAKQDFGTKPVLDKSLDRGKKQEPVVISEPKIPDAGGSAASVPVPAPAKKQKRGLGSRIQDGWDRFKYWAGGGGKAVNNKTRNWLADGKEGSWRRNKAERLADKEYENGFHYIKSELQRENSSQLSTLFGKREVDLSTCVAAKEKKTEVENALRADEFAAKMREAGKSRGGNIDALEMLEAMDDFTSTMMTEYGEYDSALNAGNGSVYRGMLWNRAKDRYIGGNQGYFNMTQEQKKEALEKNFRSDMRYRGVTEDKVAIGDTYKGMLQSRNNRARNSEYANRIERHERGLKKLQELNSMLEG